MITFDQVKVAAMLGYGLSLIFTLIPPLQEWFDSLKGWRPLIMFLATGAITVVWLGLDCQWSVQCMTSNWLQAALIWISAFASNQGGHLMLTKPVQKLLGQ